MAAEPIETAGSPQVNLTTASLRFTFDQVDMPQPGETMGLVGASYLLDLGKHVYGGVGVYGAATGERGGFFTGGFEGGLRLKVSEKLTAETGLFVGGGGGGSAPQGGGLMLRPRAGLKYDFGAFRVGGEYSQVKFPNGEIDSSQFSVLLEFPFTVLSMGPEWAGKTIWAGDLPQETRLNLGLVRESYMATGRAYLPADGARTTTGAPQDSNVYLAGFDYRRYSDSGRTFWSLEVAGAAGGESDGYAEVLAGVGYRIPLFGGRRAHATVSAALGEGGGGLVDTGGGVLMRAMGSVEYRVLPQWSVVAEGGYVKAPAGSFEGLVGGLKLAYSVDQARHRPGHAMPVNQRLLVEEWDVTASHQTYLSPQRKSGPKGDDPIDLVGFKMTSYKDANWYVAGQALGAYEGGAGGYAVGLFGMGWRSPGLFHDRVFLKGEIMVGASGGGSVSVGGGAIAQPMLGLEYRFTDQLGFQVMAGKVQSASGSLSTNVVDIGLNYRFGVPGRNFNN